MKILLLGPYPPPHGGISVHVYELRKQLHMAGIDCQVVNVDRRALESADYLCVRSGFGLLWTMNQHTRRGWTLHVHVNGHNRRSWLIALTAGVAGWFGPGSVLTVHSGLAPEYLASGRLARWMAGLACSFYTWVVAVSPAVHDALLSLGLSAERIAVVPAFLAAQPARSDRHEPDHFTHRSPILATTLFFRPEYGFRVLVEAMDQLRRRYPEIVCLVMGSGEEQEQAEQLVVKRGLQEWISLLGNVTHEKCLSLLSRADLFVRPTLVDGDASSVREALAMGIRVVASNAGHRPQGVVLFRAGDGDDLAAKIEEAWLRPGLGAMPGGDNFGTLIDLYESIGRPRRQVDNGKAQSIA
jgi:glycogen(starch) synthase